MSLTALQWAAETPVAEPFDYKALAKPVATAARAAAERIRSHGLKAAGAYLDIGRELLAIKDQLGHGHFGAWLRAEFQMSERMAQRNMSAATLFENKSDIVSFLPATTVYALAAPSTPAPVREAVVARLEAGERINPSVVARIIQEGRKEEREKERRTPEERAKEKKAALRQKQRNLRSSIASFQSDLEQKMAEVREEDRAASIIVQHVPAADIPSLLDALEKCRSIGATAIRRVIDPESGADYHRSRYINETRRRIEDMESELEKLAKS